VHLMFADHRALDPLRTALTIIRELRRHHPGQALPTAGFNRWLDGGDWATDRLDRLDLDGFLDQASQAGQAFADGLAEARLYA